MAKSLKENYLRLRQELKSDAEQLGFDQLGIAPSTDDTKKAARLQEFIQRNYHGSMDWMAETAERRANPKSLWPDAKSVIMLAMNYGPDFNPLDNLQQVTKGTISVYARNRDYHEIIKGRLKTLSSKLLSKAKRMGIDGEVKVFVDTAPVMEKPLAGKAGLGWQGKHTNLVSRDLGSWFFLGCIFTNLDLPCDEAESDNCGSCRACLDVCPTSAFPAPYQLDARRCISYLTIENKGPVPVEFRKAMGNRIFGCDDCLAVCPWNKFAGIAREAKLAAPENPGSAELADLLALDDAAFRHRFSGSPVKRIGRSRFIRNCLIAAGNSNKGELACSVGEHLTDPDSLIRGAAIWALGELQPDELINHQNNLQNDSDAGVRAEWSHFRSKSLLNGEKS